MLFHLLYLNLKFLFGGLISLLTITNPLSKIPLFVTLTRNMEAKQRASQAKWACLYAAAIMCVCLLAGNILLSVFGISYGALRIAGGFVVTVLGYRMLFLSQTGMLFYENSRNENYAFFPLAMPGISGPGTMAVVIGISTEIAELPTIAAQGLAISMTLVAIGATSFAMWLVLRSSMAVFAKLGQTGCDVMTRLMGFLLICIGVQFIGSGIRTFMTGG